MRPHRPCARELLSELKALEGLQRSVRRLRGVMPARLNCARFNPLPLPTCTRWLTRCVNMGKKCLPTSGATDGKPYGLQR